MAYFTLLVLSLGVFWLLLSGFWDNGLLLAAGVGSTLATAWFGWKIARLDGERARVPKGMILRLPMLWLWVFREIVKANIDVLKRLWLPARYPISPTLRRLPATQTSEVGRVIYANSITLTPGTVSIEMDDRAILVHALSVEAMEDLQSGRMDRRITQAESGKA